MQEFHKLTVPSRVKIPNKTVNIINCVILNHGILLCVLTDAPGILKFPYCECMNLGAITHTVWLIPKM